MPSRCQGGDPSRPLVSKRRARVWAALSSCLILAAPTAAGPAIRRELVFVDARLGGQRALLHDLRAQSDATRTLDVIVVDAERDGLAQISDALAGRDPIGAIHILSHGSEGRLRLGNRELDAEALTARADLVSGWATALTADADILLYGCNAGAGESGRALMQTLARVTGADVAASQDPTGNRRLGGDWDLERRTGTIEARVAPSARAQRQWAGVLASNGTVAAEQKISDLAGGLAAILDNTDALGLAVAGIGDLDNDGIEDIVVGAYQDDDGGTNRGAVYVLFLNTNGTVKAEQKISDTVGGLAAILVNNDNFGSSVDAIGDLDNDGVEDIVVGAHFDDNGGIDRGAVYILFLNTNGTVKAEQKISSTVGGLAGPLDNSDRFGIDVAGIGDLDNDGVEDIAVGAILDDDGGADRGAVYVLFLNTNGTVKAEQKISSTVGGLTGPLDNSDFFGISVAGIGDLDGDSVEDIAVGAILDDDGGADRGALYVLFLNSNGAVKAEQKISDTVGGLAAILDDSDNFGTSVDSMGDLDGDGVNDIAVGAWTDDDGGADRGAVYVLFLNSNGTVKAEQKISDTVGGLTATLDDSDAFGRAVAGIGDLNGDGVNDIAVGASGDDDGGLDRGAVHILLLAPSTPLFRSVGITATSLASGAANALTITGSTATFGSGLPPNIGVGDVIQYDSDGNASIDALAFIHGRTNSQTYTVKNKNGAAPTAVIGDNNWDIYRAYTSLFNWELQAENLNILEPVENDVNPSLNLVTAKAIMFVACYGDGADTSAVFINDWITGPANYIRIFTPYLLSQVGVTQRHSGVWDTTKYRIEVANTQVIDIGPIGGGNIWIDGLQIYLLSANGNGQDAINIDQTTNYADHRISNNIIRAGPITASAVYGIYAKDALGSYVVRIWNNIIYGFNGQPNNTAIYSDGDYGATFTIYAYNNTVYDCQRGYYKNGAAAGPFILKNNIAYNNTDNYDAAGSTFDGSSTNNLSGPGADAQMPATAARNGVAVTFVLPGGSPANLHLAPGDAGAQNFGAILSSDPNLAVLNDIDGQVRQVAWDIGADDANGTTAVKLISFEARPLDSANSLTWQTGSELDNLGFHVYRALSADGPWTRISASLIPGLGSSAVGRAYSFRDGGLTNGVRYFYRLEDVDASSKTTSHGPVSAVPLVGAAGGAPGSEAPGASPSAKKNASSASCPEWVIAAYGSTVGSEAATTPLRCTRHGDPEAVSLGVVARDARSATLELRTGGFYALHTPSSAGEPAGTVRVFVPGFDFPQGEQAAALPIRRALVDAVVGRRVQLGGVRALDLVSFKGLVPSSLGKAEMQVGRDGTVRATRRASARAPRPFPKSELARLLPSLFQGERKSAVVEIVPLRFEAQRQQLVLAKRVLVRLLFTGRETGERGRGSLGRAPRAGKPVSGEVLARLYSTSVGLHAVSFEQLFPGRARGVAASRLRLERQGEPVSFHLEPAADAFGPGSRLYFYAERAAASTDFMAEVAFELVSGGGGIVMPLQSAAPTASAAATALSVSRAFEVNRFYQPGLLAAPDLWLWEALASGVTRVKSFSLAGVAGLDGGSGTAELDVFLQGASESGQAVDHHVSVSVNGTRVGEGQFAGKRPYRMSLSLPGSLLREGTNELALTNVADTGVTSVVFLDRFSIAHPQLGSLTSGLFEGTWAESGTATVLGLSGSAALVDVTAFTGNGGGQGATTGAKWLSGYEAAAGSVRFHAEAGHRYRVVSPEALLTPRVAAAARSTLRATTNQADYLLIAPRAFLTAAEPLVQRRQDQGLEARAVAFEEIAEQFGYGQASAEAIQSFLAYAFQSWARPSPRYVLLLGDSSYDPRNFMGTSQPSLLPALWAKTSYLWTVSDPLLAAVNGADALPDMAIGRLPAASVEQAQMLVEKLLAWEDSGQGLNGTAALVADNPDIGGDFEADVRDIAQSYLAGRSDLILLSQLGAETRPRVLDALNSGLSYLNYVGHGGAAVWASENVWNSWDAASLQAQSLQPLLLTLNCLNGYFVAPSFDSLSESLLKAEGRGAIAAFSPSGLSLDGPAHEYHRALMQELTSGQHQRLGDAVLAAQRTYAASGLMPELLGIYHLLGDPATSTR